MKIPFIVRIKFLVTYSPQIKMEHGIGSECHLQAIAYVTFYCYFQRERFPTYCPYSTSIFHYGINEYGSFKSWEKLAPL